jgi:hypothetical protein
MKNEPEEKNHNITGVAYRHIYHKNKLRFDSSEKAFANAIIYRNLHGV